MVEFLPPEDPEFEAAKRTAEFVSEAIKAVGYRDNAKKETKTLEELEAEASLASNRLAFEKEVFDFAKEIFLSKKFSLAESVELSRTFLRMKSDKVSPLLKLYNETQEACAVKRRLERERKLQGREPPPKKIFW
jgi:hypothetical protein